MLSDKPIRTYINQANKVLQKAVNYGIADNVIPERMRQHLDNDTFLFSGHKVHSALEQANIKLRNEKGNIKSFDTFKQEVKGIDKAYNQTYLQAEYQFAVSSSQSAANWAKTQADGDRYNLRYKTAGDDNVRDSHRILDGITLPPSDPFWNSYYPPNGWRCRCEAIQVRKSKYETTDPDQAENAGQKATSQIGKDGANKAQIFRFNPGKQERIFPPKHPYYKAPGEVMEVLEGMNNQKAIAKEILRKGREEIIGKYIYEHDKFSAHFVKNSFTENLRYGELFEGKVDILRNIKKYMPKRSASFEYEKNIDISRKTNVKGYYVFETKYKGEIELFKERKVQLKFEERDGSVVFYFIKFI